MSDEFFIENQVKFMYGKYYYPIINNSTIYSKNIDREISVHNCLYNQSGIDYKNDGTQDRLRDFINILKKYWKKNPYGYIISSNWHDNVHYDNFVITYNRDFNSKNQVIFPLVSYHLPMYLKIDDHTDFRSKQNKLFWRGTSTGHDEIQHNKRYNIISRNFNVHHEIDVGFNHLCQCVYENNRDAFDILKKENLDKHDQLQFKFILNIEGNDASSSFPWALASNCCPLHNYQYKSETYLFGLGLEPYIHFVPINNDGSDLLEKYNWCLNNLHKCEEIARNGKKYMEKYQRDDLYNEIMIRFFNLYPRYVAE